MNTPEAPVAVTEKPAVPEQIKGQHIYFAVRGASSEAGYAAAKDKGLRVLNVVRLREEVPALTEEIEIDHPEKKGEKMKVKVQSLKQTPVYSSIDTSEVDEQVGRGNEQDQRRAKNGKIEAIVESEFVFIVKASAPRA